MLTTQSSDDRRDHGEHLGEVVAPAVLVDLARGPARRADQLNPFEPDKLI